MPAVNDVIGDDGGYSDDCCGKEGVDGGFNLFIDNEHDSIDENDEDRCECAGWMDDEQAPYYGYKGDDKKEFLLLDDPYCEEKKEEAEG